MAIPDYESLMLPLLALVSTQAEVATADAVRQLGRQLQLSEEQLSTMLPSGVSTTFGSRVGWAKTYLKQAGLLSQPRRGVMQVTARGREVLSRKPARIDNELLSTFPEFVAFRNRSRNGRLESPGAAGRDVRGLPVTPLAPPQERLDEAARELNETVADDLLSAVKTCSPGFFEELVVKLLLRMGYGGSRQEAGKAVGRSGDGGIDGVINEDRLGLDSIYVQAKRWQGAVGEPEIRDFLGSLVGRGASKGVFITAGAFSEAAKRFAERSLQQRIVLIDGERLAQLMIEHGLGVSVVATYDIKRIDSDFFAEE
ncbi:MAG TPA: restriction endonuclease [Steroidobacteraceae bacterium]